MAELFGKKWRVRIDTIVTDAHDVAFQVTKTRKRQPNTCSLSIWNLSEPQRRHIEALSIPQKTAAGTQRTGRGKIRVEITAGYKDATSLIFRGDLRQAVTTREGPSLITTIEGDDGGRDVLLARVSRSFPAGTPVRTVVRACVDALGIGTGNLESLSYATRDGGTFPQGTVLSGRADAELTRILHSCGVTWSVQNGALQVLQAGRPLAASAVLLTPESGLIGTPAVNPEGFIEAQALLVPGVFPGSRVKIQCPTLTGVYWVNAVTHVGDTQSAEPFSHQMELRP